MRPIEHPSTSRYAGAEPGMTPEESGALPVSDLRDDVGAPMVGTFWQPSAEDLKLIAAGHPVCVMIWGRVQPPISVIVGTKTVSKDSLT